MKTVILTLSAAFFLNGCASDDSKQADQTPRFGQPVSSIPWNQPTDWEKGGQLGTMPAFEQQH
jgi:PBP1b-binding outer membrane lipoprotein LpoB